jgi:hypothetical protein
MRTTALALGILFLVTAVGCAGNSQQQMSADTDGNNTPPASIYSVMDPTSLVYTDVRAGSAAYDNPWRWVAFALHPVGLALDYGLNRPIYKVPSKMQYIFGYTAEDSMLDGQRR